MTAIIVQNPGYWGVDAFASNQLGTNYYDSSDLYALASLPSEVVWTDVHQTYRQTSFVENIVVGPSSSPGSSAGGFSVVVAMDHMDVVECDGEFDGTVVWGMNSTTASGSLSYDVTDDTNPSQVNSGTLEVGFSLNYSGTTAGFAGYYDMNLSCAYFSVSVIDGTMTIMEAGNEEPVEIYYNVGLDEGGSYSFNMSIPYSDASTLSMGVTYSSHLATHALGWGDRVFDPYYGGSQDCGVGFSFYMTL